MLVGNIGVLIFDEITVQTVKLFRKQNKTKDSEKNLYLRVLLTILLHLMNKGENITVTQINFSLTYSMLLSAKF